MSDALGGITGDPLDPLSTVPPNPQEATSEPTGGEASSESGGAGPAVILELGAGSEPSYGLYTSNGTLANPAPETPVEEPGTPPDTGDAGATGDTGGTTEAGDTGGAGGATDTGDVGGSGGTTGADETGGSGGTTETGDTGGAGGATDTGDVGGSGGTTGTDETGGSGDTTETGDADGATDAEDAGGTTGSGETGGTGGATGGGGSAGSTGSTGPGGAAGLVTGSSDTARRTRHVAKPTMESDSVAKNRNDEETVSNKVRSETVLAEATKGVEKTQEAGKESTPNDAVVSGANRRIEVGTRKPLLPGLGGKFQDGPETQTAFALGGIGQKSTSTAASNPWALAPLQTGQVKENPFAPEVDRSNGTKGVNPYVATRNDVESPLVAGSLTDRNSRAVNPYQPNDRESRFGSAVGSTNSTKNPYAPAESSQGTLDSDPRKQGVGGERTDESALGQVRSNPLDAEMGKMKSALQAYGKTNLGPDSSRIWL
jgi:hypothetical protein